MKTSMIVKENFYKFLGICLIAILAPFWQGLHAKEVSIKKRGLNLLADYEKVNDSKTIYLVLHGTLAHNKMETIEALSTVLKENGHNYLAINLSLGIDKRSSAMYDCNVTHKHKHTNAMKEIKAWVKYLNKNGYKTIHLVGHSRGANQIAWYYNREKKNKTVKTATLIAPSTWDKKKHKSHPNFKKAKKLIKQKKKQHVFKNVDFLYCKNSNATAETIVDYYTPRRNFNTPSMLKKINKPVLVIIGSEDKVVMDLPEKMKQVKNPKVKQVTIDDADHFFRDLFTEDVYTHLAEFTSKYK